MKLFLSSFMFLLSIENAEAFGSKKKEERDRLVAEKIQMCNRAAINYTYQGIQEKYSHWKYDVNSFSTNFSYVDEDGFLVVHVREKYYKFPHKIILSNETCEVFGHESLAF